MTRYVSEESSCAACGHQQQVRLLVSTNSFSPASLEGRPGGQASLAILNAIQECESCGYCAPQISQLPGGIDPAPAIRRTSLLRKSQANRWRVWSEIAEEAGDLAAAGWASLHGAWAAECERLPESARSSRLRAAKLFGECRSNGIEYGGSRAFEISVAADVLRRAGDFESARQVLAELGSRQTVESSFVLDRSEAGDVGDYSTADAARFAREGSRWRPPVLGIIVTRRGRIRLGLFVAGALVIILFDSPTILWVGLSALGACFLDMLWVTFNRAP